MVSEVCEVVPRKLTTNRETAAGGDENTDRPQSEEKAPEGMATLRAEVGLPSGNSKAQAEDAASTSGARTDEAEPSLVEQAPGTELCGRGGGAVEAAHAPVQAAGAADGAVAAEAVDRQVEQGKRVRWAEPLVTKEWKVQEHKEPGQRGSGVGSKQEGSGDGAPAASSWDRVESVRLTSAGRDQMELSVVRQDGGRAWLRSTEVSTDGSPTAAEVRRRMAMVEAVIKGSRGRKGRQRSQSV